MSNRGRMSSHASRSYGSTGQHFPSTRQSIIDKTAYNTALIENLHEPLMTQIRQVTAVESDGPFPSKFKEISRIRRRPILRTKSESDFGRLVLTDEDVEEIRNKLIRDRGKIPTFHLKSVPSFSSHQKLVLMSLLLVDFTSFCSMSILAPFFPERAADKGVSATISGFIFSVYALVVFLTSPFMGIVVSKVGPKFLMIAGVFLCGACNILFGLLDLIESSLVFTIYCFAVRIIEAIGAAAFSTASYTYVAKLFPDNIGAVLGILETFVGLGLSVGPAIGGVLYDWGGYGLPFYSLGTLMILTIPLNVLLLPSSEFSGEEEESESMLKLFRVKPIIIISLVVVIVSNSWGFLDPTLSTHLKDFNLSAKQLGLFFLLCSSLYGLSSPAWGYIADQMTQTWILMVIGLILSSFGLLLLGPSPFLPISNTIWSNIIALVILGLSISMALLPTFEAMLDFAIDAGYKDDVQLYGLIAGLWSSMYSLGEVIGPSLGAALMDHYGFPISSTVMAILCLSLGIFVLIYFLGFYRLPPLSSLRGGRDRDKLLAEILCDSGISENEISNEALNNRPLSSSNTSSSSSSLQRQTSSSVEVVVVSIQQPNESTPLVLPPTNRKRRYSLENQMADYGSVPNLGPERSIVKVIKSKFGAILQTNECDNSSYGTSYPKVLKTMSITRFGAVEV